MAEPQRSAPASTTTIAGYLTAQVAGAISRAILARSNVRPRLVTFSYTARTAPHLWIGKVVATACLILLIAALVRSHRTSYAPAARHTADVGRVARGDPVVRLTGLVRRRSPATERSVSCNST